MRVGLDLRLLQTPAGLQAAGAYTRELLRALRAAAGRDDRLVGLVSAASPQEQVERNLLDEMAEIPGPVRKNSLRNRFVMGPVLRDLALDVHHSPLHALPVRLPGLKVVQTVHDLSPLLFPDGLTLGQRLGSRARLSGAARADRVVAVSKSMRLDLDRLCSIPGERVAVIYPGIAERFRGASPDEAEMEQSLGRLGLRRPYVLHAGGYEDVKNLVIVLAVFLRLRRAGLPHRLVVAGDADGNGSAFQREVDSFELTEHVDRTGWVDGKDLRAVYHGADLMLYPSHYEGFGLAPLQAMACGVPVVAADSGSLPEVLGDACPLVDPRDHETMATEARRLLEDPEARAAAVERGRHRADLYRWDEAGRRMLQLYRSLAGERTDAGVSA